MSDHAKSTRPTDDPRPPMSAEERQAAVDGLSTQIEALGSPHTTVDPVRRVVYGAHAILGPIADEIRDPSRAEAALEALAVIVRVIQEEKEAARPNRESSFR